MNCLGTSNTGAGGCCNANTLCSFNGNLEDVVSTPIYVRLRCCPIPHERNENRSESAVYSGAAMWLHHQSGQRDPL